MRAPLAKTIHLDALEQGSTAYLVLGAVRHMATTISVKGKKLGVVWMAP
jgi:hypothetical protein